MISDLVLSLFAFYFYFQHRITSRKWSLFFLTLGLSAFTGGIYHGYYEIGELFRFLSWGLLSASLYFAVLSVYHQYLNLLLKNIVLMKSLLLFFLSVYYVNFIFMVIDTAISLLVIVVFGNFFFLKSLSKYISYGILISLSSIVFIVFKISFHPLYLTYNDIGHYISILTLFLISKGVTQDYTKSLTKAIKV